MDKKNKKILLITISTVWIIIEIMLEGGLLMKTMNTAFEPFENITFILAIILLIIGICIEISKTEINNNDKKILKYKILRAIGYLPFIGILLYGIFSMFNGFTFIFSTSYGFEAFIGTIIIYSIIIWPLYILGLILIIKSNNKIKNFSSKSIINDEENIEQEVTFTTNNQEENNINNNNQ